MGTKPLSSRAVQGQLFLRDGVYLAEDDIQLDLQGLYVPETGQLKTIVEPAAAPLHTQLNAHEPGDNTPDYR